MLRILENRLTDIRNETENYLEDHDLPPYIKRYHNRPTICNDPDTCTDNSHFYVDEEPREPLQLLDKLISEVIHYMEDLHE